MPFYSLAADKIIFNSEFNRTSFLENIDPFIKIQPDLKLKGLRSKIEVKSNILYFPINFDRMPSRCNRSNDRTELHLVWPHRWEHDKNPQLLTNVLFDLDQRQIPYSISIVGEQYDERLECFNEIQMKLSTRIKHFGYLSREDYLKCLMDCDIVISTANHEFYGVSMYVILVDR